MTQKERQERSKREILRAAQEEFGASSYENVSMEGICTRHGISKGMMYHYYANKDQLFLRCVEEVFNGLGSFLREECAGLVEKSGRECLKQYLLARERYFQKYPKEKNIFENALFHPPKQLREQIQQLRRPLREYNSWLLQQVVSKLPLRPGITEAQARLYVEGIEYLFWELLRQYRPGMEFDLHQVSLAGEELLDMILFGVARQDAAK